MKKAPRKPVLSDSKRDVRTKPLPRWMRKKEANLKKRGAIYFQLGLILAMILTYLGLEASFQSSENSILTISEWEEPIIVMEQIPVIQEEKPIPLKTKVVYNPAEFIISESDPVDVDALIQPEIPQFPPLPLDSIRYSDSTKDEPPLILIDLVDEVPVFPGCEDVKDKKACFNEMMQKHIIKNFRYPEIAQELGIQGRVSVMFTIQNDGSIGNIRYSGPDKNLEAEALRIIQKLPKMTPGKQKGKPVRVPFSIPILFKLQ
ncbi:energy transducer TonB [Muriicola sp. E247]|uniref:energy transducer TonB n=1 Tax=Muriicola sp. E247 TaxID=3242730 RepID=UPI0035254CFF